MKNVTVRDYFAGQYLNAYVNQNFASMNLNKETVSLEAFEWADKMIDARSRSRMDEIMTNPLIQKEEILRSMEYDAVEVICKSEYDRVLDELQSIKLERDKLIRKLKSTAPSALQVVDDLHICRQQLQKEMERTGMVEEANKTLRDNLTQLTSHNQNLECECDRLRKMLRDEERITKNLSIKNSNISNELQSIKETLRKLSGE